MTSGCFVAMLIVLVGAPAEKETAGTPRFQDKYFDIESGRPRRPERPQRTMSAPSGEVKSATETPAVEIIPGTTEEIRILRVQDTERIDAVRSLRFSLLGIEGFSRRRTEPYSETYGHLAYVVIKGLTEGKSVTVEYDEGSRPIDGRIPVYLFLPDGRLLNRVLVENGLGIVDDATETLKYRAVLEEAQKSAKERGVGYWTQSADNSPGDSK
ncbi:MAG: thermonuclease family protein [bacterium]